MPETDAEVIRRLRAGAVLLGKTSVGALAFGDVWYGGADPQPMEPRRRLTWIKRWFRVRHRGRPGGFAIGTETLGSIVAPCARCGATGLRPTFGRVSRAGAMALCWSLDKIGPICRPVDDTALVLAAINGFDPHDEGSIAAPFGWDATRPAAGLRVGYIAVNYTEKLDLDVLETVRSLGAATIPLELPDLPYDALRHLLFAEAAAAFEELTLEDTDDTLARQDAGAWPNSFRKARFLSAVDHIQLDRLRRRVMQEMDALFSRVDVVLAPANGPDDPDRQHDGPPVPDHPSRLHRDADAGDAGLPGRRDQGDGGPGAHRAVRHHHRGAPVRRGCGTHPRPCARGSIGSRRPSAEPAVTSTRLILVCDM